MIIPNPIGPAPQDAEVNAAIADIDSVCSDALHVIYDAAAQFETMVMSIVGGCNTSLGTKASQAITNIGKPIKKAVDTVLLVADGMISDATYWVDDAQRIATPESHPIIAEQPPQELSTTGEREGSSIALPQTAGINPPQVPAQSSPPATQPETGLGIGVGVGDGTIGNAPPVCPPGFVAKLVYDFTVGTTVWKCLPAGGGDGNTGPPPPPPPDCLCDFKDWFVDFVKYFKTIFCDWYLTSSGNVGQSVRMNPCIGAMDINLQLTPEEDQITARQFHPCIFTTEVPFSFRYGNMVIPSSELGKRYLGDTVGETVDVAERSRQMRSDDWSAIVNSSLLYDIETNDYSRVKQEG